MTNYRIGRYAQAETALEKAVKLDDQNEEYHFNLGVVYDKLGKLEAAVREMRRVIAINPKYSSAYNFIGYLYADRGENLDESVRLIKKALELEPDNGYFVDSLGWAYFKKGMLSEAMEKMEKAVSLIPNDTTVLDHMGDVYFKLKMNRKALEQWEKILKINPGDKNASRKIEKLKNFMEKETSKR
jgi:tetratricopeptide (TPR) repeat protein